MARNEIEGLVILLDVGVSMSNQLNRTTTCLQACVDIIQMIAQRKMFQSSKDEIALILYGTHGTANELWNGNDDEDDHYAHVTVARQLSQVDWKLIDYIQNNIVTSNLEGDLLDGLVIASNHFHEDQNKSKKFKEKRIFVLTDYSCSTNDSDKLDLISKGLSKHGIKVNVISPFSSEQEDHHHQNEEHATTSTDSSKNHQNDDNGFVYRKEMTRKQQQVLVKLREICEQTDGAVYSFEEALTLLSIYQAKSVISAGTKFTLNIGKNFHLPIVSMIKCKENKPDIFKFKKVYAKDDTIELKTDRACFTKDDEQRDLDEKTDVVDAYRYGSTYVPIDADADLLKLKVEKCFSLLGFTKSQHIRRHYYLSDSVQQINPDSAADKNVHEAFVNIIHAMYVENVCGLVRKVFNVRSSPELGCLIPYLSKELTCMFYVALPFEDDLKKFTLESFSLKKKSQPNETQLNLIDQLIDHMDLTPNHEEEEEEDDGDKSNTYNPHIVFNPYIQRMFQSIGLRATNPKADLPQFEDHITNSYLKMFRQNFQSNNTVKSLLKRCVEEFELNANESNKKSKKNCADGENTHIFYENNKQETSNNNDKNQDNSLNEKGKYKFHFEIIKK
jgi:hypothetical protein